MPKIDMTQRARQFLVEPEEWTDASVARFTEVQCREAMEEAAKLAAQYGSCDCNECQRAEKFGCPSAQEAIRRKSAELYGETK